MPRASAQPLLLEPLENRILLSAEIGIPPNDPLLDALDNMSFVTLESRFVDTFAKAGVQTVDRAVAQLPDVPLEWVLPARSEFRPAEDLFREWYWADREPFLNARFSAGPADRESDSGMSLEELKLAKDRPVIMLAPGDNGSVVGTQGDDTFVNDTLNIEYRGLAGNDVYLFIDGWGEDIVTEVQDEGNDTIDFSAVTADLTFTFNADGTIDVTDGTNTVAVSANIENVISGSGDDTFVFLDGAPLQVSIDGGIGQDELFVDGSGSTLTDTNSTSLIFGGGSQGIVTHSGMELVQVDNATVALTSAELQSLSEGLRELATRLDQLESVSGFDASIPLADPFGATFGDLVNFGYVMQQLADDFDAEFLGAGSPANTSNADVTQFLNDWIADIQAVVAGSSEDISGTISWLAETLFADDQVLVDGAGIAALRFTQQLSSRRDSEFDLNLSDTLRNQSVTVARDTTFDFGSEFGLDYTFGIADIFSDNNAEEFFVDESLDLAATGALSPGLVAFSADALIGFVDGTVSAELTTLSANTQVGLGPSGGSWTLTELQAANPFVIGSEAGTIDVSLDFDTGTGFDASVADIADGLIGLASDNFLTENLVVSLPGSSDDFTLITPNELLRMLDQLGEWLGGLSQSEILDLDVPFAGNTTIGDLVDFGEAFGEELLRYLVQHDGLRLSAELLTSGVLPADGGDITFSIEIKRAAGVAETYDIVLAPGVTSTNSSAEDLRADFETALSDAVGAQLASEIEVFLEEGRIGFRPTPGAVDVIGVSLPSVGNESLGFAGNNLTVPTAAFESGVLGHEVEFTLNVDGTEHTITVARDANNTSIDDLVDDINAALDLEFGIGNINVILDPTTTQQLAFQVAADATDSDGMPVGSVILVDVRDSSSLVEGLLSLGVEAASFFSAQDLADQLSEILSGIVGGITVNFDVANSEMSFTVELARTFDIASLPIDVSVDLGEFIDIESDALLGVTADAGLQFTFGVDLDPSRSLVVAPPVSVPELPNLGQLLENASFDFTLMQDNFAADERLSRGSLNVGDWTVTANNGNADSVTWTAPTSGRLFDTNDEPNADHHFFVKVTDNDGEVTYVDAILLSFDTDDNAGPDDLAADLETSIILALASRGFSGLQVSITNATATGFDISASGAGFDSHELQLITDDQFEVAKISDVTIPSSETDDNQSLKDLLKDLQNAISNATTLANLEPIDDTLLGLTGVTSIGNQSPVVGDTEVPANGVLSRDVHFAIDIDGTRYRGIVSASTTLDNEQESEAEPDPIAALAADVEAAINAAIVASGRSFDVNSTNDQRLEFTFSDTNAELHFFTPAVIAQFNGQRFSVYAVPVLVQPDANNPGKLLTRRITVDTEFDDSAFEKLGLSSSPIPADGVLDSAATFQIVVDDVPYTIIVDADSNNRTVGDLIDDINAALEDEIGNTDVQVRPVMLTDTVGSDGNRIEFFTAADSGIRSLVLPALQPDDTNAAIQQLGFSTEDDYSARIQSGEFFIRDATLGGGLDLDATDINASAVVGVGSDDGVGIGVGVVDSTGGVFADIVLNLVNPNDGTSQVSLGELWDYLGSGNLDLTELVDADITGGVAIDLDVAPILPIRTPIEPAQVDISLELTDWLNNPPSLEDASASNGLSVNISGLDLNIYDALSNLSFSDVVDALQHVADFLRDLQGNGAGEGGIAAILDEPLPLLNQSPSELLLVADHFAELVDEVIANPADSLGKLEKMLEDLLGVPEELVTLALDFDDGIALRVDMQFNAGIRESFGFDLDLETLVDLTITDSLARTLLDGVSGLVGVSSTGDLSVGVDGTVRLSFGIALGNGNGSAEALGFRDGATSSDGTLTADGDAQAAADRLVDQDIEFELVVDGESYFVTVTAGDQTADPTRVDGNTLLSDLKNAPDLNDDLDTADISITLRDGTIHEVDLNPLGNDPTIDEVVAYLIIAGGNEFSAAFEPLSQRIIIQDTSTAPAESRQSGVYVTQTGVSEFAAIQFSLQVGVGNDPVPVSVPDMSSQDGITRKQWLAAIDEAIRKAMVDAGQLNPVAAAVVDVAYNGIVNGGQLTFQGTGEGFGERLTIYRGGTFSIKDLDSSTFAEELGLKGSDDNGDRIIIGKELRTDQEADVEGLAADVQRAVNEAMGLDENTQVVDVSLLPSQTGGVGRLEFTTNPAQDLEIHSITQALAPFLYNGEDGTALILGAGASGDNLEFTAQVGPFGFFVIDGSANLEANFLVTLQDTGETDGRTYFGQDEFSVQTDYGGSATAELPLYFPTESTPVNDEDNTLDIGIADLLAFFNSESGSVEISTPDLTAFPTPTLIGMLSNPEYIIDGLDSVLLSIQDALDGEIYGVEMPLIGDGLAPAGQFIADFREDVLAYLSLKLREGGLNPVTLVQETLYNVFGGEDDGDPAALRVLGFEPDTSGTGTIVAGTLLSSGGLGRDAEFNITVGGEDTTRIVVFADDIADDSPQALVDAVNDSLDGRGLADFVTAGFVEDSGGGFRLTFTATDISDEILLETAGAIQLDLFGLSVGALDFLQDVTDDGIVDIGDILKTGFGLFDEFGQFDFLLGQSAVFGQSLDFDIGLPILAFDLDAGVEVDFGWELGFGFGVSQDDGFYFVSDSALAPDSILNPGESGELIISVDVSLLGVLGFSPGTGSDIDPTDGPVVLTATAELPDNGRLSGDVVFALDVGGTVVDNITLLASATSDNGNASDLAADIEAAINNALGAAGLSTTLVTAEIELDGEGNPTEHLKLIAAAGTGLAIYDSATAFGSLGFLQIRAVDGGRDALGQVSSQYSGLGLEIVVDILDPGRGSSQDGRLSFAELSSSSTQLSDILVAEANGGALVDLGLTVNFDAFDLDGALLPAIGTDLFIDWDVSFSTATGADIAEPIVEFQDITLDLGSFISDFAGPFLEDIGAFIEPLGFLLDPQDGLLYQRLPVISDLAGETVTLKELAEALDTENKITPFLNALEQIYFLVDLVSDAAIEAEGGPILLEFGTITLNNLGELSDQGLTLADANPVGNLNTSASNDFNRTSGNSTPATQSFTRNVTRPGNGSVTFNILQAGTIVDLLLGKPDVSLIEYDLPPFGFDFEYLQRFPIYPPLFATLRGFFSASIDLGFGYDTLGVNQFLASDNPLDLVNGFFLTDLDASGIDIPEVTLYGGIAAGASLDVAVASAGVEGGIDATIYFNLNDPDQDNKVRLSEMLGNILLNYYNPIAIFDTSGKIDAFLRAYVEVLFGLWSAEYEVARVTLASFDIPFIRAPILAQDVGNGVLQLNTGPTSDARIHGSLVDGDDNLSMRYANGSVYVSNNAGIEQRFVGIDKVYVNLGAGNDTIDLRGLAGSGIEVEVHGGTGNDIIFGAADSQNRLFGGAGNDRITGGNMADEIDGGEGNDTINAGDGADVIRGGAGADRIFAGAGNDDIEGGTGDDFIDGGAGNDVYRFGNNWGDDEIAQDADGLDTWDFTGTTTDVGYAFGRDLRIGNVDNVSRSADQLRITSTRHGLQTGDQVSLSGIQLLDANGNVLEVQASAIVTVDPDDPDSFTIGVAGLPDGDAYVEGSGIFQLARTALGVDEFRPSDTAAGAEQLIQVETDLSHGLQDGDVVYIGSIDPLTGEATLNPTAYNVTIVDKNTFNLDGTSYADPPFAFENAFVQRVERGTGLVESVAVSAGAITFTSAEHGLSVGDLITITGTSVSNPSVDAGVLNNSFVVSAVAADGDTFTISVDGAISDTVVADDVDVSTAVWQLNYTGAESLSNSVVHNGFSIEHIVGGRGGDAFDIYQTGAQEIVLDGAGGSDVYRTFAINERVGAGAASNTRLFDTGDFWDTDVAVFFGSQSGDRLMVDNTNVVTVLDETRSDNPSFRYSEPNTVVGFQSGAAAVGTLLAGNALPDGDLDRNARMLLTVGDADPVLVVVEPDDVGGTGTVLDLVAAINVAIDNSDLAGLLAADEHSVDGESFVRFVATDSAAEISIDNLSQGSGIEALEVDALGGNDNVLIDSTSSRTAVRVSGGLGDDLITVGGPESGSNDIVTLNGIRGSVLTGSLVINGNEGYNSLFVTDAEDAGDNEGSMTDSRISGLGMQVDIEYSDISLVSVQLGSGADNFVIENTINGTSTVLGGGGDDDIDVQTARGILNVAGEGGDDAILLQTSNSGSYVAIAGGSGADDIDIRSMDGDARVAGDGGNDIIEVGSMAGSGMPGLVNLINGALDISGGTGIDTLIVDDSADGALSTTAQAPLSSIASANGRLSGDASLELDFGDGDIVPVLIAADTGTLSAAAALDAAVLTSGQLSADAFFVLTVGDETYEVTVDRDTGNQSITDLLHDINDALDRVGLEPDRVVARLDGDTLVLDSLQGEDLHLQVEADDPAATELEFADATDALFGNNSIADLEADINAALAAAGIGSRVSASIDTADNTLSLTLLSGNYLRVALDGEDPASVDLGLANNQLIQPDNVGYLRVDPISGRAELTGLGMGETGDGSPGITYDSVANVVVTLGSGHDEFNVQGTLNDEGPALQSLTTISTGEGDDVINVSDAAPDTTADRGYLDGTLDAISGELSILAGDGHNTLNVSDRGAAAGDPNVVITQNRIEGLAAGAIDYDATGGFAGGVTVWAGAGSDTIEIRGSRSGDVTTLHAGAGDDRIRMTDTNAAAERGLLVIEAGIGDDFVDGTPWTAPLIVFGDLGDVDYLDRTRALSQITAVSTQSIETGGADELLGGLANNLLMGGASGDVISGGLGNDIVIGDGGRVTFTNGVIDQIGATDFFIGGDDILAGGQIRDDAAGGGDGNDVIIGGAGQDLLYGDLSEDILIYEYGRVTFDEGLATSVVVLGQSPLDHVASTLFGLYLKERFVVSPYHVGDVVSDHAPVEASVVTISTGGQALRSAYHEEVCANFLAQVSFETGSSQLTPESQSYLQATAEALADYGGTAIYIRGYADSQGAADVNQRLSQQRAEAVRSALIRYGIASDMLRAVGHGVEMPVGDNATEEGRRENRRVEIDVNSDSACDAADAPASEGAGMIGLFALTGWRNMRSHTARTLEQRINW